MLKTMIVKAPIGALTLVGSASVLEALYLPEYDGPLPASETGKTPLLERVADQLAEYFAGNRKEFDVPLAPKGTPFQQLVWNALLDIPYGEVRSYGEQAKAIGRPAASRAVGAANGRNPISIIVPCHRVIGANGTLTGYGGGLPLKQWLLEHERRYCPVGQKMIGQQRLFA